MQIYTSVPEVKLFLVHPSNKLLLVSEDAHLRNGSTGVKKGYMVLINISFQRRQVISNRYFHNISPCSNTFICLHE